MGQRDGASVPNTSRPSRLAGVTLI
jgi:hypothetical protein